MCLWYFSTSSSRSGRCRPDAGRRGGTRPRGGLDRWKTPPLCEGSRSDIMSDVTTRLMFSPLACFTAAMIATPSSRQPDLRFQSGRLPDVPGGLPNPFAAGVPIQQFVLDGRGEDRSSAYACSLIRGVLGLSFPIHARTAVGLTSFSRISQRRIDQPVEVPRSAPATRWWGTSSASGCHCGTASPAAEPAASTRPTRSAGAPERSSPPRPLWR